MAKLIPQLSALDVDSYVRFLSDAFGFEVTSTWRDPNDATDVNVEVEFQGVVVGIGHSRATTRVAKDPSAPNIGLYVLVDDVDARALPASARRKRDDHLGARRSAVRTPYVRRG